MIDEDQLAAAVERIRPRVRGHAGDLAVKVEGDDHVEVEFFAVCESCPAMAVTFAGLVRTTLLEVPGVARVTAPQVHASDRALDRIASSLGRGRTPVDLVMRRPPARRSDDAADEAPVDA